LYCTFASEKKIHCKAPIKLEKIINENMDDKEKKVLFIRGKKETFFEVYESPINCSGVIVQKKKMKWIIVKLRKKS